jgi:hypothetical protein
VIADLSISYRVVIIACDPRLHRSFRHCEERSDEAIYAPLYSANGLLRCARNDDTGYIILLAPFGSYL